EAGGVVLRAVDAQARRQALDRGGKIVLGSVEIALSSQRHHVGVDDGHWGSPSNLLEPFQWLGLGSGGAIPRWNASRLVRSYRRVRSELEDLFSMRTRFFRRFL